VGLDGGMSDSSVTGPTPDGLGAVLVETTGAVGRITLNAPERLNAVDP
jgi:hypothetical protein